MATKGIHAVVEALGIGKQIGITVGLQPVTILVPKKTKIMLAMVSVHIRVMVLSFMKSSLGIVTAISH
ncbi:MAG: hypothetical protein OEY52_01270 [Gammaproteobacteria bacterium]|nr:hypothetical protein [Gammaproteobacteria bacterium]